jgi:hypothetical protein
MVPLSNAMAATSMVLPVLADAATWPSVSRLAHSASRRQVCTPAAVTAPNEPAPAANRV